MRRCKTIPNSNGWRPSNSPRDCSPNSRPLAPGQWESTAFLEVLSDQTALQRDQLADAGVSEIEQAVQCLTSERECFGRTLELDVQAGARLDDIHIDVGFRVL